MFFFNVCFFFFNDTATTEIYTLSLHDALPISLAGASIMYHVLHLIALDKPVAPTMRDRKSTRLNSSHVESSYAVLCLKQKIAAPPAAGCARLHPPSPGAFSGP